MKMLTRLMATGAVLAAGSVSLAADCQNAAPRAYYYGTNSAPVGRYSYRSGYAQQSAPVTTMGVPLQAMSPYSDTASSATLGPERNLDYARARQHIRGW